jgi:hypothetical protein
MIRNRLNLCGSRVCAVALVLASLAALKLLQAASGTPPPQFHLAGWFPVDITADPVKGVLVLERQGQVSRIFSDGTDLHQEILFTVSLPEVAEAITAGGDAVYVSANSRNGCMIFRYTFTTREVTRKSISPTSACEGIAAAGHSLFVILAKTKQLELWENWDSESPRVESLQQLQHPGFLVFDKISQRLLVSEAPDSLRADMKSPEAADLIHQMPITDFRVHAVSVQNGKVTLVTSGIGQRITSIAPVADHIFIASGKRISMIRRSDNQSEKVPPALETMTGGAISGVASDVSGKLWYADMSKGTIAGPLTIE